MSDIAELVDSIDLDAALARTYRRYEELKREVVAKRRRRMIGGAIAAAAAAAIAVAVPLAVSGSSGHPVRLPDVAGQPGSTTTTLDPNAEPVVPDGFVPSDDGEIRTLIATTPQPHDSSSGVGVGASSTAIERARVVSSSPGPVLRSVTVQFGCLRLPEQITEVRYQVTPDAVVVDGMIGYDAASGNCPDPNHGPVITLPLRDPLPAGLPVVAGQIPSQ